jgi:integrase/recombinase XerD
MSIEALIEPFVAHLRGRGQTERNARSYYAYPLHSVLIPFCANEGIAEVEDLTPEAVDRLALSVHQREKRDGTRISDATAAAYLKAVKYFLQWAGQDARAKQIRPGALRRKHRDVLSATEVQALEDACIHERNRLIIRLLYETGAREGGIANLRVEDLISRDREHQYLRMRDKTGERLAPIPPPLFRRLDAYAKHGRPRTSSRALFIQQQRRAGRHAYEALTEAGIYAVVKDAADRAELGKRVYPHLLRHSAITRMVAAGMHPALISDITGVSVAVIARHYSYPSDEQKYEAMARLWR